ncbi:MAG: sigma-54 dependent transcriptional regulator [Polyangiaceae bacterium]
MNRGSILVVDDDPFSREMLEECLGLRGFSVASCAAISPALERIQHDEGLSVVLTDLRLAGETGLDLCAAAHLARPALPVIVITAFGSIRTAMEAMRAGAYDFITKPLDLDVIAVSLDRAAKHNALQSELTRLRRIIQPEEGLPGLIGSSASMQRAFELIGLAADSDATVLITGESGTGKELAAKALHELSDRKGRPFVALNCAAIPESLLESELFGHLRGAFTDARSERSGLFVKAGDGTLFLDEIGDLPAAFQVKLLRALQERTVRPVGSDREVPFAARIVAATHHDLEAAVTRGSFRQDLFYRINVIEIPLPPLRARGQDVLVLAQHFLTRFVARRARGEVTLSAAVAEHLLRYDWPGNVRELENTIERALALSRSPEIVREDLPERIRRSSERRVIISADEPTDLVSLEEVERRYILRVMDAVSGNKSLAADILGLDRSTLYRKLERFAGVPKPKTGGERA